MNQINLTAVIGTRPEATKMSPLLFALHARDDCNLRLFFTGQHTHLVRQIMDDLGMSDIFGSELSTLPSKPPDRQWAKQAREELRHLLAERVNNGVLVLGDTASARLGAEIAVEAKIAVCHIEAGLRLTKTDLPEEINRREISKLASIHCAPSWHEMHNLLAEGIDKAIFVIGDLSALYRQFAIARIAGTIHTTNGVEDALVAVDENILASRISTATNYILCTFHRQTSLQHWPQLITWLRSVAQHIEPQRLILCTRLDTRWQPFYSEISATNSALIVSAARPLVFQILLRYASCVITDSAGVQQEALLSGKHVFATREEVELYKHHPLLHLVPPPFVFDRISAEDLLTGSSHWTIPNLDWEKPARAIADKIIQAIMTWASNS